MVRYQTLKRMAGTHHAQDRSEVAVTGKKMYKQKGTGGARHGDKSAPQFRGGGKAFGPKPRSHAIEMPKKVREPFTIDDVKKSIEAGGIQATAKAIYNSLGYLTRKHKITRIGHGRYMLEGAGELPALEELDAGPPTRLMIDDY